MAEGEPLLVAANLQKTYTDGVPTPVLHDINLTVGPGEFIALVGQSGSGKTTLLNLLGALDRPTAGTIVLAGQDYGRLSEAAMADLRRRCIGFVFQSHYLLAGFTVLENALMPLLVRFGRPPPDDLRYVLSLLERVGLASLLDRPANQLSGGQAQRVAVVRALANRPALILADEPTGNLDSVNGRTVFDVIRELNEVRGSSLVLVTHDERLAVEAGRLVRIQDGRIVQDVPTPAYSRGE